MDGVPLEGELVSMAGAAGTGVSMTGALPFPLFFLWETGFALGLRLDMVVWCGWIGVRYVGKVVEKEGAGELV